MKTGLGIAVSFILGGVAGAVVYHCVSPIEQTHGVQASLGGGAIVTTDLSETLRDEITQASAINLKDGSRYQVYQLDVAQEGLLHITQQGPLNSHLVLLNSDQEVLQSSTTKEAFYYSRTPNQDPLTLIVSGQSDSDYGPFRIAGEWLDVQNSGELAPGEAIQGYLDSAPNTYQFIVEESGMYQFDMRTSQFDSYLRLEGNGVNAVDDDSGDGLNARLSVLLEPGEYRLTSTTPYRDADGSFGTFSLEAARLSGIADLQQGGEVVLGETVQSYMQQGSMQFTITLDEGRQLTLDARSDAFDTVMEVTGEGASFYNDDGGDGTNSRIQEYFEAGQYQVLVRPFSSGQGLFTLRVQ